MFAPEHGNRTLPSTARRKAMKSRSSRRRASLSSLPSAGGGAGAQAPALAVCCCRWSDRMISHGLSPCHSSAGSWSGAEPDSGRAAASCAVLPNRRTALTDSCDEFDCWNNEIIRGRRGVPRITATGRRISAFRSTTRFAHSRRPRFISVHWPNWCRAPSGRVGLC